MYADSLAFFDLEGKPPVAHPDLCLKLAHLTCSHPFPGIIRGEMTASFEDVKNYFDKFKYCLNAQSRVNILRNRAGLVENYSHTNVILGLQNPPQDKLAMKWMAEEDIFFTTLAYYGAGVYGSGYNDKEGGLTERGKVFLQDCADWGRIVDYSHASVKTIRDTMAFVDGEGLNLKVVITHAGLSSVFDHPRNLPDDVIKWVVNRRGGFIGVPMFMFFLDETDDSLEPFVKHLLCAVDKFGGDHVTIGSDTPYVHESEDVIKAHLKRLGGVLDPEGKTKPRELQHPIKFYTPEKMRLVEEYLKSSVNDSTLEKLVGLNFFNWCKDNLPESMRM